MQRSDNQATRNTRESLKNSRASRTGTSRTANLGSAGGSGGMQMAMEKIRNPSDRFVSGQIPYKIEDAEERAKIREMCRFYFRTHNLIPLCIDVYTRFPIQGMEIQCKDPELKKFYEELFFNQLNYKQFLIDVGREFFTVGEVNILGTFNILLGVWESEEIVNPDDLIVTKTVSGEPRYTLKVPEHIMKIVETRKPKYEYDLLVSEYPEMVQAARESSANLGHYGDDDEQLGTGLEVDDVVLSRIVNKSTPWDTYGTPHMLRAFTLLNLEEGLYAAQKAVADRLYSPLILAKLGSPDLGDGEPWVPDPEQLDAFTDQMAQAMAADFRFLAYNFGIEIESVFGRESVPRFDGDFDRIESKMLEVWGIGESLISGSQGQGAYASSALNSEFVTQLMTTYQENIREHFKKRVQVVADAKGHFDYEENNGERTTIMETYIEVDDEGEEHVKERPKLLLPEITFATMNLRDEAQERELMLELKQAGVPISDAALLLNTDLDWEEQISNMQEEKIRKISAQAEMIQKAIKVLTERNLPLPPELILAQAQQSAPPPQPPPVSQPVVNDITAPTMGAPDISMDPNAGQLAMQNMQMLPPGGAPVPADPGAAPAAPSAPTLGGPPEQPGSRPEISDNMRGNMPRM